MKPESAPDPYKRQEICKLTVARCGTPRRLTWLQHKLYRWQLKWERQWSVGESESRISKPMNSHSCNIFGNGKRKKHKRDSKPMNSQQLQQAPWLYNSQPWFHHCNCGLQLWPKLPSKPIPTTPSLPQEIVATRLFTTNTNHILIAYTTTRHWHLQIAILHHCEPNIISLHHQFH